MKILQTFGGTDYELTDEQAANIESASTLGSNKGIWLGGDYIAFASIKGITKVPEKESGSKLLLGPGLGYGGIISQAKRISHLEALGFGICKAIEKVGGPCHNANILLKKVEDRIRDIKNPKPAEVARPLPPPPLVEKVEVAAVVAEVILPDPALEIEVPF